MCRQDDQTGHPFGEREHHVGGSGELAPHADPGHLAAFQQVSGVGQVADQQQRWLGVPPD